VADGSAAGAPRRAPRQTQPQRAGHPVHHKNSYSPRNSIAIPQKSAGNRDLLTNSCETFRTGAGSSSWRSMRCPGGGQMLPCDRSKSYIGQEPSARRNQRIVEAGGKPIVIRRGWHSRCDVRRHDNNNRHQRIAVQLPLDRAGLRASRKRLELRDLRACSQQRAARERIGLLALPALGRAGRSGRTASHACVEHA
jgi:hypothetical protein